MNGNGGLPTLEKSVAIKQSVIDDTPIQERVKDDAELLISSQECRVEWLTLRVPIVRFGVPESRHISRRADVQLMSLAQSATLDGIAEGLKDEGSLLLNGRPVRSITDAVKWILESLSASPIA